MRRERCHPINDFGQAASWLTGFLATRSKPGGTRTLYSRKFEDLIYRSFIHDDPEFQNFLTANKENEPYLAELANDVFILLFSQVIRLKDDHAVCDRSQSYSRPIIDGLLRDSSFAELKYLCEDKELPAYSGSKAFCESFLSGVSDKKQSAKSYFKYLDTIEMLEKQVNAIAQILNTFLILDRDSPLTPSDQRKFIENINKLVNKLGQLKNLREKVKQGISLYSSEMKNVIHNSVEEALQSAANTNAVMMAWGEDPGEMKNTKENRELLKHVKNSKTLADMAQTLGKYREILSKKRKNGFAYGLGEKYDIAYGNSLEKCLSSEISLLTTPETSVLFELKYQQKKLKQYRKRAAIVKGDGDMIVLIDESGSTSNVQCWAKSLAMAMLDIAAKGKRKFALIHFASKDEIKVDLFEPGHYTSYDLMEAVEHFFNGGTDFEAPLKEALSLVQKGYEKADLTIITDGECEISESFAKTFAEQKIMNCITMTGILLDAGCECGQSLEQFCDTIYHARDMAEDDIAISILEKKSA